jgi:hypothetical protein
LTTRAGDGIDKDWGDKNETALASILNGFSTGSLRNNSNAVVADPSVEAINDKLSQREFKGTIDTRGLQ